MPAFNCAVIVPAYNAAEFIDETLDAIFAQTIPASEVIVVNDGSSDATEDILRRRKEPITLISQVNRGLGMARAAGIRSASAKWIALCDSDDIWRKDHLERRAALSATYPDANFTFSDCYSFGPNADPTVSLLGSAPDGWMSRWCSDWHGDFFRIADPLAATLEYNPIYACGLVFTRDGYEHMGGFLERYSRWRAEDVEFTRRFFTLEDIRVAGDRQLTWGYRRHASNYSAQQWRNLLARARILETHLERNLVPERLIAATQTEIANARGAAFDISYWDGDYAATSELFRDELPPHLRNMKRRLRLLASKIRAVVG